MNNTYKPNEAKGAYVSTVNGPVLLSKFFPENTLREDQRITPKWDQKKRSWAFGNGPGSLGKIFGQ